MSVPACKDIVEEQWLPATSVRLNTADNNHSRQERKGGSGDSLLAATKHMFPLSISQPDLQFMLYWYKGNGTFDFLKVNINPNHANSI